MMQQYSCQCKSLLRLTLRLQIKFFLLYTFGTLEWIVMLQSVIALISYQFWELFSCFFVSQCLASTKNTNLSSRILWILTWTLVLTWSRTKYFWAGIREHKWFSFTFTRTANCLCMHVVSGLCDTAIKNSISSIQPIDSVEENWWFFHGLEKSQIILLNKYLHTFGSNWSNEISGKNRRFRNSLVSPGE